MATSILQGLGGLGRDIGSGAEIVRKQKLDAADEQLRQMQAQLQLSEFQERVKQANKEQIHGTFSTPDGSIYAIVQGADGTIKPQSLYKGNNQRPEFSSLQAAEAWAVDHNDQPFLKSVQDAIKATQKPAAPAKPTEFDEWRDQFKQRVGRDPNDREIALWHRQPRADAGGGGDDATAAYAEDIMAHRIKVSDIPMKQRSAVMNYIHKGGGMPPRANTAEETRRADLAENVYENAQQLEDIIQRRPELFGKVAGFTTYLRQFATSDPDIAALRDIRDNLGRAAQGAHGMRSARGVEDAARAIMGHLMDSPEALRNSINTSKKSVFTFLKDTGREGDVDEYGGEPGGANPDVPAVIKALSGGGGG